MLTNDSVPPRGRCLDLFVLYQMEDVSTDSVYPYVAGFGTCLCTFTRKMLSTDGVNPRGSCWGLFCTVRWKMLTIDSLPPRGRCWDLFV
jgi:hypothetical protein